MKSITVIAGAALLLAAATDFATPMSAPNDGVTIDMRDGELHYLVLGPDSGVPLILANGGPGLDHKSLAQSPVWEALARGRPVVLYDQRGTGQSTSSTPIGAVTVATLVRDLEALRTQLRAPRVDLLGWSWGGFLAMAYAIDHGSHVDHLVLVDAAPPKLSENVYLFDSVFPDITAHQAPNLTRAGKVGCEKERIRDYLAMEFYDPNKRDLYLARGSPFFFSEEMCTAVLEDALKLDLTSRVRVLTIPTLVITGRFDMNVAPIVSYKLSKTIPGAKFHVFDRSGHMPFQEQPEEFASIVGAFLDRRH
jgi:proline iminopeptidase